MSTPIKQLSPSLNAYTFQFDEALLDPIRRLYSVLIAPMLEKHPALLGGGNTIQTTFVYPKYRFYVLSYKEAPLLWVSNDDLPTYLPFKAFFDALQIDEEVKRLIDYDKNIVMYCGFFVVGDHLDKELWHVDYFDGANAFTLITPLFDLATQHGRLLYADENKRKYRYEYKTGEAIFFGDGFAHTTQPYPKTNGRVLLSLTFGTDKTQYWDVLEKTIGTQSKFLILPCGHQAGTCECVALKYRANYMV